MNILPNILTAPMAASALAGLLAFVPNPMLSQLGLAGSMGLGGYAVATSQTDPRRQRQLKGMADDRAVRSLKQELADVQTRIRNLSRDKKQLTDELTQVQSARAGLVDKVKTLELAVGDKAASPAIDICEYTKRLQALKASIADKDAQLSELATALEAANAGTDERVAKVKADTLLTGSARFELEGEIEQLTEDKQKLAAAYKSLNSALENAGLQYDAELSELGGIKDAQDNEALATIQHWQKQAATLADRITELEAEAQKPARFGGTGTADIKGNLVIDFFASKGYVMVAHETDPDADKGLRVSLKPDTPISVEVVNKLLGELGQFTNTYSTPKVSFSNRYYHFRLAVDGPFKEADKVEPKTPISRFEKTLDKAMHVRICAGSGSGKSVLMANVLHYLIHSLDNAKVTLLDPKAIDDWGVFEPEYYGSECIEGVQVLADGLGWRVDAQVAAKRSGGKLPIFEPIVFGCDEAQVLYLDAQNADTSHIKQRGENAPDYAKKAKGSFAKLLSLGRAYKAMGVFVTQLPQVTKVGLNDGSFDPCVNIFLGAQIDNALEGFVPDNGFTSAKVKALEKEIALRRSYNQKFIALIVDLPNTDAYFIESPDQYYYERKLAKLQTSPPPNMARNPKMDEGAKKLESVVPIDVASVQAPLTMESDNPKSAPIVEVDPSGSTKLDKAPKADKGRCPSCQTISTRRKGTTVNKKGLARFFCDELSCSKSTFGAPLI